MKKKVVNINSKRQPILETDEDKRIIKITIQYNGNIYISNYFGEIHYQEYAADMRDHISAGNPVKDLLKGFMIDNDAETEIAYSYKIENNIVYVYMHDAYQPFWDYVNPIKSF